MTRRFLALTLAAAATSCATPEPKSAGPATLACQDLGERVHTSPLEAQEGPLDVQPLTAHDLDSYDRDESELAPSTPVGARMSFGAPMGWTRPWLERWVACYRENQPSAPGDPLTHDESDVEVRALRGGFAIDVFSKDREVAERLQAEARNYAERE